LQPQDYVAVVSFASVVKVEQPSTQDRAKAITAIRGLQAAGNTALYEAVAQSATLAAGAVVPRRAVVLLTDGENFGPVTGTSREGSITTAAQVGGAPFYTVGVGTTVDAAYLADLVGKTGGRTFQASGAEEIPRVYEAIQQLLRSQLAIRFLSTADSAESARTVDVTLTDALTGASASFHRDYQSRRAAATPTAAPTAGSVATFATETPVVSTTTETTSGGRGGGQYEIVLPLVVLAGLLVLGAAVYIRRRGSAPEVGGLVEAGSSPWPSRGPRSSAAERRAVRLLLVAGAPEDTAGEIELREIPITLGTSKKCDIRLPEADGVGEVHARLWLKDGTPVLHHLAPGRQTLVDGSPVEWASLRPRSILQIGPYQYRISPD
jgi:hypothetical protein